ncbi:MAG: hypothetical protein CFE27_08775 [Alphaproteobacteria bacterium PA1]|nr:MAG: hypothetical protein CFE27_08775 [Alphaproteobacteria bacterium PA1]
MTKKLPPHFQLANLEDFDLTDPKPEIVVELTYELDPKDGKTVQFKFKVDYLNHPDVPESLPPMSFVVLQDCKITVRLDSTIKWRWSRRYFEISSKADYGALYGGLHSKDDHEFYFFARENSSEYHKSTVQSFNLNLEYQQGDRWLPITIDPDVGNPRPPKIAEDQTWLKLNGGTSITTTITGTI